MTHADPTIHIKSKAPENVVTMIVPGRRALGEEWSYVTIGATPDGIVVNRSDIREHGIEAPPTGKPIVAIGAREQVYAEYIIAAMQARAQERALNPQHMSQAERMQIVNEAWHNYVEQKLRMYQGKSQFGPSGFTQRQKVHRDPNS